MKRWSPGIVSLLGLLLVTLACSLTAEAPPTLAPSTPMSTITPYVGIAPPTLQPQMSNNFNVPTPAGVQPALPSNIVRPSILNQVDPNRMLVDINTLVNFQSRHILSTAASTTGIQAAQNWLITRLTEIAGSTPDPNAIIHVFPHQFQMEHCGQVVYPSNVVMSVTGTDAAAGVVLVTGHYDTALQSWCVGDSFQPGANDNGSGVSAMLEMARLVVQQPHRATIVFVFFTAEETGRQGSLQFVRDWITPNNIPVVAVINMDIIGNSVGRRGEVYDNQIRVFSAGPNTNSSSRYLARMADVAVSRYVPEIDVIVENQLDRSNRWGDHQSFSDAGYPAIRMIEAAEDPTIAHTTRDTIDRIDPTYLTRSTQAALAILQMAANGPNPPTLRPLYTSTTDPASMVLEWAHNPFCVSYVVALRRFEGLTYEEFYTVEGATSLSWGGFKNFEAVSVACVDAQGQLGRFAPELLIQPTETAGAN